jgi:hypothetical protein
VPEKNVSDAETSRDVTVAIAAYNHKNACPWMATSSHGTPHYYMAASLGEALF